MTSSADKRLEREQLYEAYNSLHSLAQDFHKPFDSPAVILVGHQTSGKSALMEAIMGFQFNQVGGGTKTRRPIALRMQYNPACPTPVCFLTTENGKEEMRSLSDIQVYIESENKRLEQDPTRCFDPREIQIRIEYKYCPNMILIDTPGMIHAPKGRNLSPQQRAVALAAKEAENLVLQKMKVQDYIILCVEDTTDWKHSTTRNVVAQADPDFSRTVLVTTKLDTKLSQFSESRDLHEFLKAPSVVKMHPQLLGGPFFTTVPCGRVGTSKDYSTNDAFVHGLQHAEALDRSQIHNKLAESSPGQGIAGTDQVGITRLRAFLEHHVEKCYRRNVAKIIPLLQRDLRDTESTLRTTESELADLSIDKLKEGANNYRERFSTGLANVIHGTVKANPVEWGETSEKEAIRGGSFLDEELTPSTQWKEVLADHVGNHEHFLYGGAQYHRTIREFCAAVANMPAPAVTPDEISNAAGMGDVHDGVNFLRAACVIAVEKAQVSFEPMLESLRERTIHVMKRMYPIVEYMVLKAPLTGSNKHAFISPVHQARLQDMMGKIFDQFVLMKVDECLQKCHDDLHGMTRFVTWDVNDFDTGKPRGQSINRDNSPVTPKKMVEIYSMAIEEIRNENQKTALAEAEREVTKTKKGLFAGSAGTRLRSGSKITASRIIDEWKAANQPTGSPSEVSPSTLIHSPSPSPSQASDDYALIQLTTEMVSSRSSHRSSNVVSSLVQHIVASWRNHFAKTVAMKFNCFYLMPFLDEFPSYLRSELDNVYSTNEGNELFDVSETRRLLQNRRVELMTECEANSRLQDRFDVIQDRLSSRDPSDSVFLDEPIRESISMEDDKSFFATDS